MRAHVQLNVTFPIHWEEKEAEGYCIWTNRNINDCYCQLTTAKGKSDVHCSLSAQGRGAG